MRLSPDALFLSPATWHTATLLLAVWTAPLKWNACSATWQRDCSEGATRRISVFPHDALESGVVGVRSNCHRYVTSTPTRADSLVMPGRTTTTKKKSNLLTFKWYSRQSVLKVRVKKEMWYRLQSERRRRLKIWGWFKKKMWMNSNEWMHKWLILQHYCHHSWQMFSVLQRQEDDLIVTGDMNTALLTSNWNTVSSCAQRNTFPVRSPWGEWAWWIVMSWFIMLRTAGTWGSHDA